MLAAAPIRALLERPVMAAFFFLSGVVYDTLTLTRIDRLSDNVILLAYLTILGVVVVVVARSDLGENGGTERAQSHWGMVIQFLFGGLFSAYAIHYSKSASLTGTAVFFALLVLLLVGNEFLRHRLTNVRLLLALYSLVSVSFFTFVLPVVTGIMHTWMFLLGAGMSALLTCFLVWVIYRGSSVVPGERALTGLPAIGLVVLVILFYFLNWIPPVPLSLRAGGIYHGAAREGDVYRLSYERGPWWRVWQHSDNPFRGEGPAYCFTAVFAPVALQTTIYHRWQFRPSDGNAQWGYVTTDRIGFPIAGGRDEGYRGVTKKQQLAPGDWRVDVETADGRIIGRVSFSVEPGSVDPQGLQTVAY